MKQLDKDGWPVDGSPLNFEDMANSVIALLKDGYKLLRKNRGKDLKYKGPDHKEQACCPPIRERLKAESLAGEMEDQGRNALDIIIGHAIQIGIEQGRRIMRESPEYQILKTNARVGETLINAKLKEIEDAKKATT
jgi:hypothetical protein